MFSIVRGPRTAYYIAPRTQIWIIYVNSYSNSPKRIYESATRKKRTPNKWSRNVPKDPQFINLWLWSVILGRSGRANLPFLSHSLQSKCLQHTNQCCGYLTTSQGHSTALPRTPSFYHHPPAVPHTKSQSRSQTQLQGGNRRSRKGCCFFTLMPTPPPPLSSPRLTSFPPIPSSSTSSSRKILKHVGK